MNFKINWKIEKRKVSELKPWPNNPRVISKFGYLKLQEKIFEQGFHAVLVIDADNTVLAGNQRLSILQEAGIEEVNVLVPDRELTKAEREKIALSDNKHEGEDDWDMLANFDPEILLEAGFNAEEVSKYFDMDPEEDGFDADKEYAAIQTPQAKEGDLYQLGRHRILCGNSEKRENWERLMGKEKAQLIFTDPPYNVDYHSPGGLSYNSQKFGGSGGKIFNDNKSDYEALKFYVRVLRNLYDFSDDNAAIYWWFANKNQWLNHEAFEQAKWNTSQIIIWLKNSMVFSHGQDYHRCYEPCMFGWKKGNAHYANKKYTDFKDVWLMDNMVDFQDQLDVWFEKRDPTNQYVHPTQKPIRLAERALRKNSKIDDLVIEGFLGSGSTMMACEQMNRRCYGMELDAKYVDVEIKRWELFTKQQAVKIT